MTREEYRGNLKTLDDDKLYILAKKYYGYELQGKKHMDNRLADIYFECKDRDIGIFERAINEAIDNKLFNYLK
jgi:hypothetical protein